MPFFSELPMLYLAVVNLAALLLMGLDKSLARRDMRRISERSLFLLPALGGAFGGTAGMFLFRHKTRHWYFRLGFPVLALLQAGIIIWLSGKVPW